jgi:hypothetical protein
VRCPRCNQATRVLYGRNKPAKYQRRRQCLECEYRFTTHEGPVGDYTGIAGPCKSPAEAQVSSLPDGGKCITIMLPPDASPDGR